MAHVSACACHPRGLRAKFPSRSGNAGKRDRFREAAVTSGDVFSVFRQQRNVVRVSYSIPDKHSYSYLQIRWMRRAMPMSAAFNTSSLWDCSGEDALYMNL